MALLHTQLNPRSAEFVANAAAMRAVVDDLKAHLEKIAVGGGEAARAKHTLGGLGRGQLAQPRRGVPRP